jgi:hypothetical protein
MADVLVPILICIIVIIAIMFLFLRQSHTAKTGKGLVSQWYRKPQKLLNLNKNTVGRLYGAGSIKPMGDNVDIIYKKGMLGSSRIEGVPRWAIISFNPPDTEHEEGIVYILPYDKDSKLATLFPAINYYREYVKTLEKQIEHMKDTNISIIDMLHERKSTTLAREEANRLLTTIEGIQGTIKGFDTQINKETQILSIPKPQEKTTIKPV